MDDKELLPLAAKAMGHQHRWSDSYHHGEMRSEILVLPSEGVWFGWNPLADDGDALRLAVVLGIWIWQYKKHEEVNCGRDHEDVEKQQDSLGESYGHDPLAATRRAIVRAAAEIGRAMP